MKKLMYAVLIGLALALASMSIVAAQDHEPTRDPDSKPTFEIQEPTREPGYPQFELPDEDQEQMFEILSNPGRPGSIDDLRLPDEGPGVLEYNCDAGLGWCGCQGENDCMDMILANVCQSGTFDCAPTGSGVICTCNMN
jgi:hypothetical protein